MPSNHSIKIYELFSRHQKLQSVTSSAVKLNTAVQMCLYVTYGPVSQLSASKSDLESIDHLYMLNDSNEVFVYCL